MPDDTTKETPPTADGAANEGEVRDANYSAPTEPGPASAQPTAQPTTGEETREQQIDRLLHQAMPLESNPVARDAELRRISVLFGIGIRVITAQFRMLLNAARARATQAANVQSAGRMFTRGDQAEAADFLLADLSTDERPLVYDVGGLFRYRDGIWKPVAEGPLVKIVKRYAGLPVSGKGPLMVSETFAKGSVSFLKAETARPGFFDAAPPGLHFTNGFLGEDGVVLQEPSPEHRARVQYDFAYAADAPPPELFLAGLATYWGADKDYMEKVLLLQEWLGAAIMGHATTYQQAMIFLGLGGDGKSKLAEIVEHCMPLGSVCKVTPDKMGQDQHRAKLNGMRCNICYETPEGELVEINHLKAIITGDSISAKEVYKTVFDFVPRAGHLFCVNGLFRVRNPDKAFKRRWQILEFKKSLTEDPAKNPAFVFTILPEIPQIVMWAIQGYARLKSQKAYTTPTSSVAAQLKWFRENDTVGTFLEEMTIPSPGYPNDPSGPEGKSTWVRASVLFSSYQDWARKNGFGLMNSTSFGKRMHSKFPIEDNERRRNDGLTWPVQLRITDMCGDSITSSMIDHEMWKNGQID